ncbi:hypothetical protein [Halobellus clavatus]|uniref:Uncharacterized protein n=1 Tax=Halobellus clavatus TaxID=660517 RepID=A0A1H3GHI3_9EURY|nr:hypothetical protein [Halobellus clavatus]SDY02465.1 hypothetical protein SAMN04487946_105160 [Halobellus clavatus]
MTDDAPQTRSAVRILAIALAVLVAVGIAPIAVSAQETPPHPHDRVYGDVTQDAETLTSGVEGESSTRESSSAGSERVGFQIPAESTPIPTENTASASTTTRAATATPSSSSGSAPSDGGGGDGTDGDNTSRGENSADATDDDAPTPTQTATGPVGALGGGSFPTIIGIVVIVGVFTGLYVYRSG